MTPRIRTLALLAGIMVLGACRGTGRIGMHPEEPTGVLFRDVEVTDAKHHFAIYVPREYTPDATWPCIVFLNGSGECGTDGTRQLSQGLMPAILSEPQRWPAVVVFPQKPDQPSQWADHDALVLAALEAARLEFNVDPARIYLTGLSQGGAGAWALGAKHPGLWAAIVPVCGYGDPVAVAPEMASIPVWAFHGLKDDVVRPEQTTAIIEAIKAEQKATGKGAEPKMTLFPDANHNAWDPAYRSEELPAWLFKQRKQR